ATSSGGGPVPVAFSPTVSGGTAPITSSCTPASGSAFSVGTTPLICSASDAAHQIASCSSSVVVTLATSPVAPLSIICPTIPPATANNGRFANVSYASPTTSGGVAPVTTSCTPPSGSQFPVGSTQVTCSATDAARQVASCAVVATVTGSSSPTPTPTPTPGTIVFTGVLSGLFGRWPAGTFNAGRYPVVTHAMTAIHPGACAALAQP